MQRPFADRIEAGKALAKRLGVLDPETTVVLALPRGGVPVAAEVAAPAGLPLDLLLVRKIGAPGHEELAVGAIVDGDDPEIIVNLSVAAQFGLSEAEVRKMGQSALKEIERRRDLYLGGRPPLSVEGKTAIVVDDGIATGASMKAALKALARRQPSHIIAAVPVAPAEILTELADYCDEVVCLETPFPFYAVGAHYVDFLQVDDGEVIAALRAANPTMASGSTGG